MITPCSKCNKRHGRDHDHGSSGTPVKSAPRPTRAFLLMASLLAGAAAASSPIDLAPHLVDDTVITGDAYKGGRGLFAVDTTWGEKLVGRRTQDDHDHDTDHALDEHEGEEGDLNLFEEDHGDEEHEGEAHEDHGVEIHEEEGHEDHEAEVHEDHEEEDHEEEGHGDHEAEVHADHEEEGHGDHDGEEDGHEDHEEEGHEDHDHDEEGHEDHDEEGHEDHDHDEHDHDEHDHDEHVHSSEAGTETISNQEEVPKPWGPVIGATLLVNCATLTGLLLLLVPAIRKGMLTSSPSQVQDHGWIIDLLIPAFAVGALMATAVFLIFPEALHLIDGSHSEDGDHEGHDDHDHRLLQEGHEDHNHNEEGQAFAKFGCGILGGFLLPIVLSIFFHRDELDEEKSALPIDEDCKSCKAEDDYESGSIPQARNGNISTAVVVVSNDKFHESALDADEEITRHLDETNRLNETDRFYNDKLTGSSPEPLEVKTKTVIDWRLGASILIGDAFHNFADGLFIGAAFLGCSYATALGIVAVSLFHEMAQELADFILLTRYVGLTVPKACVLNFMSGLSVCLGGITVLAARPSDQTIGIILAFAGGVYVNIAASESMPRIERSIKDRSDRVLTLFSIALGTVPIGLILLDHKHCG